MVDHQPTTARLTTTSANPKHLTAVMRTADVNDILCYPVSPMDKYIKK
jgi:hypothetical protein